MARWGHCSRVGLGYCNEYSYRKQGREGTIRRLPPQEKPGGTIDNLSIETGERLLEDSIDSGLCDGKHYK